MLPHLLFIFTSSNKQFADKLKLHRRRKPPNREEQKQIHTIFNSITEVACLGVQIITLIQSNFDLLWIKQKTIQENE